MNLSNQRLALHAGAVIFLILVGGAFLVAGWIPPPTPDQSQADIASIFDDHERVRVAAAMFFFGGAFFVAPCAVMAIQMRRIEGPNAVMALIQIVSAAIGVVALQIPGALWLAISFRDGIDPTTVAALNDVAWFFLLGAVGSAVMQNAALAACILGSDGSVYPRWLGYVNLWLISGLLFGILIPFFKTGPLAWDGALGFWVVAIDFFVWVFVMWTLTAKAVNSEEAGARPGSPVASQATI